MDDSARSLASRTRGQLIAVGDPGYDEARQTFNGLLDRRPRLVFRPTDTADVVAAVRWAHEHPEVLVEIADWESAEARLAHMLEAAASGAYAPLAELLAAPFRATVIGQLP